MKKYATLALVYAICAMVFGVFYREFTKIIGFTGDTTLSVMHTHYFVLGMFLFLLLLVLENAFHFSSHKLMRPFMLLYNTGLNLTAAMFLVRGTFQALQSPLSSGADAAISGIAGIGHILLGIGILLMLVALRKTVVQKQAAA